MPTCRQSPLCCAGVSRWGPAAGRRVQHLPLRAAAPAHAASIPNPPSATVRYISHLYWAFMALAINDFASRDGWGCPNSIPPPCSVSGDQVGGGQLHGHGGADSVGSTCFRANGFPWQRQAPLWTGTHSDKTAVQPAAWLCIDMLCCAATPPLCLRPQILAQLGFSGKHLWEGFVGLLGLAVRRCWRALPCWRGLECG